MSAFEQRPYHAETLPIDLWMPQSRRSGRPNLGDETMRGADILVEMLIGCGVEAEDVRSF